MHWKTQLKLEHRPCCARRIQVVRREGVAIETGPFKKFNLLVVMRDKGDVTLDCGAVARLLAHKTRVGAPEPGTAVRVTNCRKVDIRCANTRVPRVGFEPTLVRV